MKSEITYSCNAYNSALLLYFIQIQSRIPMLIQTENINAAYEPINRQVKSTKKD